MKYGKLVGLQEAKRTVLFTNGGKLSLHNVTTFDYSGEAFRIECNEGYVILYPDKVLGFIIDGVKVSRA